MKLLNLLVFVVAALVGCADPDDHEAFTVREQSVSGGIEGEYMTLSVHTTVRWKNKRYHAPSAQYNVIGVMTFKGIDQSLKKMQPLDLHALDGPDGVAQNSLVFKLPLDMAARIKDVDLYVVPVEPKSL